MTVRALLLLALVATLVATRIANYANSLMSKAVERETQEILRP